LMHPSIVGSPYGESLKRFPEGALCDAGHQDRVGNTSKCTPTGNRCWRMDLHVESSVADPRANAPELLIDELKHLRLVLGERLGGRLSRGSDELGVGATLVAPCHSAEDLDGKVAAVMSLVESSNVAKLARQRDINIDQNARSIRALEQTLENLKAAGYQTALQTIGGLQDVRNLLAHHNWDERIFALRKFGIDLPIDDPGDAWLRIATGVRDALREIRLALELTGATTDQAPTA
jgi:hypothetical protein